MIFSYLLATSVPIIMFIIILIYIFSTKRSSTINIRLTGYLSEIKNNIYSKAEKQRNIAFSLAGRITPKYNLSQTINYAIPQNTRGSIQKPEIIELFRKSQLIDKEFWYEHALYLEYGTTSNQANYLWQQLQKPEYNRFSTLSIPIIISNSLVIKNCALIYDSGAKEKQGMVICSTPINQQYLAKLVGTNTNLIVFIETDNGILFSMDKFNKHNTNFNIPVFELKENRDYKLVSIDGVGDYIFTRDELYFKTYSRQGKLVISRIADIGILYNADVIKKDVRYFNWIAILVVVFIILSITFLAVFSSRIITVPILNLESMVNSFDSELKPIPLPPKINDEISVLQASFSRMSNNINRDFEQAARVQKSILTDSVYYSSIVELEIDICYLPMNSKISGDYYNVSYLDNGITTILIADILGHGTQAALSTMQLHVLNIESLAISEPDKRLEFLECRFTEEFKTKNYFTSFLVNITNDKIKYAGAAHPTQYLIKTKKQQIIKLESDGMVMGVLDKNKFLTHVAVVETGDIILLFTDGLFEEFDSDGKEFGEERLFEYINNKLKVGLDNIGMRELNSDILSKVDTYRDNTSINDDTTLISIRIK